MDRKTARLIIMAVPLVAAWSVSAGLIDGLMRPPKAWSGNVPDDRVTIERIPPEHEGGHGYRLVYHVDVPITAYWKFKIDFDNDFLIENKYIRHHRLVSRTPDIAITENKYTFGPDVFFRWRTTLYHTQFRLDFVLLNPVECRQRYQYGTIQLVPEESGTRVIQQAYFDFQGASFWAFFPWHGGMRDFLTYTAQWEQTTVLRLKDRYDDTANPPH